MSSPDQHFDLNAAPMRVGTVALKVRDIDTVAAFYQRVLGLNRLDATGKHVTLGAGQTPLLHLHGDPALAPRDPRHAGLFHTAFLMSRPDLARWLVHVVAAGVPLQGASDHIVSEALYLADPEGNGIEVYADRPTGGWRDGSGAITMSTERLDLEALMRAAGGSRWEGFPQDGSIGHVHLQVSDTAEADRFYRDVLGFDIAARYPGASFYGSGGYHHQLAGNTWNSRRAAARPDDMAGLAEVQLVLRDRALIDAIAGRAEGAGIDITQDGDATVLRDPWGTAIALRA